MKKDPDSENKELLAKQIEVGKRLDAELAEASVQIINVRDMVTLLKEMLEKQSNLKFVSLENKAAVPEFIEKAQQAEATQADEAITIYRHSVVLKMEGSYSSTLSYLQALEKTAMAVFLARHRNRNRIISKCIDNTGSLFAGIKRRADRCLKAHQIFLL